ncbi:MULTISPECIES: hypothetical protein [environmental samples]|nr:MULTISPECIES: hypothetical protein [environmental samples]CCY09094.1 uncharacterized protein BN460_00668 [Porphyromonas sp. CAG:1061]
MLKSEKKKYVFKQLDQLLKPQGYRATKTGGAPYYMLDKDNAKYKFYLNFSDMGDLYFSKYYIELKEVTKILKRVFDLDNPLIDFRQANIHPTINDKSKNPFIYKIIDNYRELKIFTDWVIDYLENDGKQFIETYSYLPNVLKRMDELVAFGEYWTGILCGGVPHLFEGLIISKLCNDPKMDEKIEYVDKIFSTKDISEYLPNYIKLKEQLPSIQPLYNV